MACANEYGRVESRAGVRLAGWLTLAGAIAVGTVVTLYHHRRECDDLNYCKDRYPYALPGVGVIAIGLGFGAYMALQSDRAEIDIR